MISAEALVATYDPPGYDDPTDILEDHQQFLEYTEAYPNAGRARIARHLDIPEGRARSWMDGSIPHAIQAVQFAADRGWTDTTPDADLGRALCLCLMGTIACGSINTRHYHVQWAPSTDAGEWRLTDSLQHLGLTLRRTHEADVNRPTEIAPTTGSTVLGRSLCTLGAPTGDKNEQSVGSIPSVLLSAGARTRAACVELYVLERGTFLESKDTIPIQTRQRPMRFRQSLARLIRSVTTEPVTVGETIQISAAAARELGIGRESPLRPE